MVYTCPQATGDRMQEVDGEAHVRLLLLCTRYSMDALTSGSQDTESPGTVITIETLTEDGVGGPVETHKNKTPSDVHIKTHWDSQKDGNFLNVNHQLFNYLMGLLSIRKVADSTD